jgi:hypothetical protein
MVTFSRFSRWMRKIKLILFRILGPFNEVRSCYRWKDALEFLTPFQRRCFQVPSWITMAIAATRIHRDLVDFTTGFTEVYDYRHFLSFSRSW